MQKRFSYYWILAKRWIWAVILGIVICGGAAFIVSKLTPPVYQASTAIIITVNSSSTSTDTTASIAAVPTYAQLLTNSLVLEPVLARHPGMTLQQLTTMMAVKTQVNTQLIELDIQNHDPRLAAQLANEISQSFERYSNAQLPASIQIWPAQVPTAPIKPKPLQDAGIGALVGLGLAVALTVLFEWIDDRPTSPEEVQELLGMEILTVIPQSSDNQRGKMLKQTPDVVEKYRMLCAGLNSAQRLHPFKSVMITSAIGGEGKSTVTTSLASFLAMTGKRVLLVDANLRHPVLDQRFQLNNQRGLSTVFLEMWTQPRAELYGQETAIPTLRVLTAGVMPPNSAELLQSQLARQLFKNFNESAFDYVIFDAPPLLPVADSQILASLVDAVILVVDASKAPRRILVRARQMLKRTHARVLGVVINKSRWSDYRNATEYYNSVQLEEAPIMVMPPVPPHKITPSNGSYSPTQPTYFDREKTFSPKVRLKGQ